MLGRYPSNFSAFALLANTPSFLAPCGGSPSFPIVPHRSPLHSPILPRIIPYLFLFTPSPYIPHPLFGAETGFHGVSNSNFLLSERYGGMSSSPLRLFRYSGNKSKLLSLYRSVPSRVTQSPSCYLPYRSIFSAETNDLVMQSPNPQFSSSIIRSILPPWFSKA